MCLNDALESNLQGGRGATVRSSLGKGMGGSVIHEAVPVPECGGGPEEPVHGASV